MKRIFLLAALFFISSISFAQSLVSLFGKATSFFTLMEESKFDTAHSFFSETEKAKVTPDKLKELWTNVKKNLGNVEYLDPIQSKAQGEFFAVTVEGKFERETQNFVLLFDKSQKLVGLFMPPKSAEYSKPFYADPSLYIEKQVYLKSGTHQMAAVVTLPKSGTNFPIVVFVHGSGPGDMDETVGPNKPFKDIAAGLAAKGIASLRYVKRTLLYPQEFQKSFTVKEEVIDDALAAIAMAKTVQGINPKNVYVFGHSLGGMLAPKLATMVPDLKGIVLAAAPARKFTDLIVEQNKYAVSFSKDTTQALQKDLQTVITNLEKTRITSLGNMRADSVIAGLPASYWVDLNLYDQVATAKKLVTPRIFVIQGGKDFQVSETDYEIWRTALGKKTNVKLKLYPEINHLLSPQLDKSNAQQYQVPVNVSESVVVDLAAWIKTP
jgi:esterase/lipase